MVLEGVIQPIIYIHAIIATTLGLLIVGFSTSAALAERRRRKGAV
jgi:hypothetical protein